MEIEWEEIKRDIEQENQIEEEQINKQIKKIMSKYELMERTEVNGQVWYHIKKDNDHIEGSFTQKLEEAERNLEELVNGKPTEPIIKILKTIEVND